MVILRLIVSICGRFKKEKSDLMTLQHQLDFADTVIALCLISPCKVILSQSEYFMIYIKYWCE